MAAIICRVEEERNTPHTIIKRRKAKWIGYKLNKNCLLKHVVEGKIEAWIKVIGK